MSTLQLALAQSESDGGGGGIIAILGLGFGLVMLAFALLMVVSAWKVFAKAGEPGWACLVPIYSLIVLVKIAGKPIWWFLFVCVPLLNIPVFISLAEKFGKSTGFGLGLVFLTPIFLPMLAFGSARYQR